ncbi:nucleic acid-binding protein [Cenarchaeum symbiosum A]|uniref:Endoribonuclease Nob1 n=1 Tax=Cenarchaeum symbiosum (strain A) TaxID=414004 RepID=A0RTK2_CENSY|nr:nucleic acid-binding protein [Cenarchaeum symbiosum A]
MCGGGRYLDNVTWVSREHIFKSVLGGVQNRRETATDMIKILDASSFYAGVPFGTSDTYHTTPQVFEEVRHIRGRQGVLDTLVGMGRIVIREPGTESLGKARSAAEKTGDVHELSAEDLSVLALSIETGGELLTDDFAVSNVAAILGIKIVPIMTAGIKRAGRWIRYCPGCKKRFNGVTECPRCGNPLKKKLVSHS